MAFNDSAVFTAATGYVYTAPVGTAAPTPKQLKFFDPETFGAHQFTLKVTGSAPYTLTVGSTATSEIKAEASLSLIHISEPTRRLRGSRMPSSA